jgi:uncharacterized protein involved in exopolysaccharide biosynthesis
LKRAESELTALRSELTKLEQQQEGKSSNENAPMTFLREAPQLGLESQRRVRDVKYATTMYDLIVQQYEVARLDESREAMVVQVFDPATPPDYKFKPSRAALVIFASLGGLCLGMMWALLAEYLEAIKQDPAQARILADIRGSLPLRKR